LPSRIVIIDGTGALSFAVLSWLAEQGIPLVKVDWRGDVVSVAGSSYAADERRVCEQMCLHNNGQAVHFAARLIQLKLVNSHRTLTANLLPSARRERALARLTSDLEELRARRPRTMAQILGVEGRAAQTYFAAWQELPIKWKGLGRKPIPSAWHFVGPRQSSAGNKSGHANVRASHPINAMLNYGYAVLESQVRLQVLADGYHPALGIMHSRKSRQNAFVLDLMEPLRPIVDGAILRLIQQHTFSTSDFLIRRDGVCRLNPELARNLVNVVYSSLAGPRTAGQKRPMIGAVPRRKLFVIGARRRDW
jgi:CRISPR-associated endonuclease Cas1